MTPYAAWHSYQSLSYNIGLSLTGTSTHHNNYTLINDITSESWFGSVNVTNSYLHGLLHDQLCNTIHGMTQLATCMPHPTDNILIMHLSLTCMYIRELYSRFVLCIGMKCIVHTCSVKLAYAYNLISDAWWPFCIQYCYLYY